MTTREERLMPNGVPKWVRLYDNGGKTIDRLTIVFTGKYRSREGEFINIGSSFNPRSYNGFWQHGFSDTQIDRPTYSHLGKKIKWENLPDDVKELVISEYVSLWEIKTHPYFQE